MAQQPAHPNTHAVLDAWRRLVYGEDTGAGPAMMDYPDVLGRLFVLNRVTVADYSFRRVGATLERLFGRALTDHNFLSLFDPADRALVAATILNACEDGRPAILSARGETLNGAMVDLEFPLAPIVRPGSVRILGLCQSTTPDQILKGRPIRRLRTTAIYPPGAAPLEPIIRLVSSR